MRWLQRMMAVAIISAITVASTVGASFGQAPEDVVSAVCDAQRLGV